MATQKDIIYPIRINKYLAQKDIASRREADELIKRGLVLINGKKAQLGDMLEEKDVVSVSKKVKKEYVYIAYNKPRGIVTHSPQEGEEGIETRFGRSDVAPLGRLDKESEGLILLSNDGRLTKKLLDPENKHEKEYTVTVHKKLHKGVVKKIEEGVSIEGYKTKPAKAKIVSATKINIVLTEGKKHQIRRMLAALGYTTKALKRVRIGTIALGSLKSGESRELIGAEREQFLQTVGL